MFASGFLPFSPDAMFFFFLGGGNTDFTHGDFTKRCVDTGYFVEECHVYVGISDDLNLYLNSASMPQPLNL